MLAHCVSTVNSDPVNVNAIWKAPLFVQNRTFPLLSMGSFCVRREFDRERLTVRGHLLRGNIFFGIIKKG